MAGLVLSAGLLGLAAMQTKALKTASGLATQQNMVHALGAFGEARLTNPNYNIVGVDQATDLPSKCNHLWAGLNPNPNSFRNITDKDLPFIRSHLNQYASCGSAALTEYADYWNEYGNYGKDFYDNAKECDYIVPRTRTVSCTLPTGDVISLSNQVWVR